MKQVIIKSEEDFYKLKEYNDKLGIIYTNEDDSEAVEYMLIISLCNIHREFTTMKRLLSSGIKYKEV